MSYWYMMNSYAIYFQMESLNWFYSVAKKLKLFWLHNLYPLLFSAQSLISRYSIWPRCHALWAGKCGGNIIKGKISRSFYLRVSSDSRVYSNTFINRNIFVSVIGLVAGKEWEESRTWIQDSCLSLALRCIFVTKFHQKSLSLIMFICKVEVCCNGLHLTELMRWNHASTMFIVKDYTNKKTLSLLKNYYHWFKRQFHF